MQQVAYNLDLVDDYDHRKIISKSGWEPVIREILDALTNAQKKRIYDSLIRYDPSTGKRIPHEGVTPSRKQALNTYFQ